MQKIKMIFSAFILFMTFICSAQSVDITPTKLYGVVSNFDLIVRVQTNANHGVVVNGIPLKSEKGKFEVNLGCASALKDESLLIVLSRLASDNEQVKVELVQLIPEVPCNGDKIISSIKNFEFNPAVLYKNWRASDRNDSVISINLL